MIVERPALERRVLASLDAGRIPVVLGGCGVGPHVAAAAARAARSARTARSTSTSPRRRRRPSAAWRRCRPRSRVRPARSRRSPAPASPRAAFDGAAGVLRRAAAPAARPATFLLDEFLDIRTFENFPGLRHVQRDLIARLAASPSRFVLASRFTARAHRLLRDAPARFEVIHVPPLDVAGGRRRSRSRFDGGRRDWAAHDRAGRRRARRRPRRPTRTCCSRRSRRWAGDRSGRRARRALRARRPR